MTFPSEDKDGDTRNEKGTWRPADEDRDEDFVNRNSAADIVEYLVR